MDTFSRILPLLPLRGMVIFPGMVMNLDIARARSLNAVNAAMRHGKKILIVSQIKSDKEEPELANLYRVGVVAEIRCRKTRKAAGLLPLRNCRHGPCGKKGWNWKPCGAW